MEFIRRMIFHLLRPSVSRGDEPNHITIISPGNPLFLLSHAGTYGLGGMMLEIAMTFCAYESGDENKRLCEDDYATLF
jgi:hypothetical protein